METARTTTTGMRLTVMLSVIVAASLPLICRTNPHAKRLYEDLLVKTEYNKLIRPVANNSKTLTVYLGLKLSQLIDVDEKNQIMTTNVWLREVWYDSKLTWDPDQYHGVSTLYIPSEEIWLPDIVIYNNADGNYEVTLMTKATVRSNGKILWEPPAIYKSSCQIDVEFFPFDSQQCTMKFGSWTYDGFQVDLRHIQQANSSEPVVEFGIDLETFYESTEWDVLRVPARRNEKTYTCCPEPYPDLTFTIVLRRKTLFYTVNLIIPCVAISFLTVMVFYLPSDSGEKITLCISILLALTVFFLLLAETIPPTSLVVPLIGKYLLFTMVLVTLSIVVTVAVLNVHFRGPSTHRMAPWVRRLFLESLPTLLLMPPHPSLQAAKKTAPPRPPPPPPPPPPPRRDAAPANPEDPWSCRQKEQREQQQQQQQTRSRQMTRDLEVLLLHTSSSWPSSSAAGRDVPKAEPEPEPEDPWLQRDLRFALRGVEFIARHLKRDNDENSIKDDWKFVALVLDRMFLWIFSIACVLGTLGIILQAPTLYDNSRAIDLQNLTYRSVQEILNKI